MIYRLTFNEGFEEMEEVRDTITLGLLCAEILHGKLAVLRAVSYTCSPHKRGVVLNVDESSDAGRQALALCVGLCEREYGAATFHIDRFPEAPAESPCVRAGG